MVGVAATVSRPEPFNAKAAKKIFGAKTALYLAKNGDKVASLMCDIVGDICGTVSGAISAVIAIDLINYYGFSNLWTNLIIIGLASSLTVGGKAFLKYYGMKNSTRIIFLVGRLLTFFHLIYDKIYVFLKKRWN
jgi:CBS domain containing-hemolysin-like protein